MPISRTTDISPPAAQAFVLGCETHRFEQSGLSEVFPPLRSINQKTRPGSRESGGNKNDRRFVPREHRSSGVQMRASCRRESRCRGCVASVQRPHWTARAAANPASPSRRISTRNSGGERSDGFREHRRNNERMVASSRRRAGTHTLDWTARSCAGDGFRSWAVSPDELQPTDVDPSSGSGGDSAIHRDRSVEGMRACRHFKAGIA